MAEGGYAWWYLDAVSDDGRHALALIAFVGSVFSPYYASARRRGGGLADPLAHCAVNVALYGPARARWAMTERGRHACVRDAQRLQIGPSTLRWDGLSLDVLLDEIAVPWPARIRGCIRLCTPAWSRHPIELDDAGRHSWSVLAPCARVEVDLDTPRQRWSGQAYLDTNRGTEPLESAFDRWDWSRARLRDGSTAVMYDIRRRDGSPLSLAMRIGPDGALRETHAPDATALPATAWRLARGCRSDAGLPPRIVRPLEDGPFYARSLLAAQWNGEPVQVMHESLSLRRFRQRWVQALLPWRMPRRAG